MGLYNVRSANRSTKNGVVGNHFGVGAGSLINADANTLDAETQGTVLGTTRRFRESDGLNVACIPEESPVSRRRIQGIYSRGAAGSAEEAPGRGPALLNPAFTPRTPRLRVKTGLGLCDPGPHAGLAGAG